MVWLNGAWGVAAAAAVAAAASPATASCSSSVTKPPAPQWPTDLNGITWPSYCFESPRTEEHFFIIGDWGGLFRGRGIPPIPAPDNKRPEVEFVDDRAQLLVAGQMKRRAKMHKPRFILNVGDNFYWGGIEVPCGLGAAAVTDRAMDQWQAVYEDIYNEELAGIPWLGVLGNHDYGGFKFVNGWDQAIAYTWGESGRWVTPAQYWSTKAAFHDFTVDLFFVDSNVNDAFLPHDNPGHNMCSGMNNPEGAACNVTGPFSTYDCTSWFLRLWEEQVIWLEDRLKKSDGHWRVVVTHFPPEFRRDVWARLARSYYIDLIVTGHRHQQEVKGRDPAVGQAAWVVSGGGGGITSEGTPRQDGMDDQYGFFDVTISRESIKLEGISHSGILRSTTLIRPRTRPDGPTSTRRATTSTTSTTTRRPRAAAGTSMTSTVSTTLTTSTTSTFVPVADDVADNASDPFDSLNVTGESDDDLDD